MPDTSKPAFPCGDHRMTQPAPGMTYRDYLIAAALTGFCTPHDSDAPFDAVANDAIQAADAVIALLAQEDSNAK